MMRTVIIRTVIMDPSWFADVRGLGHVRVAGRLPVGTLLRV